ncbi:hypothetical protein [Mesorhizobium delmotii]|nr:hypothetical protein [Mesorhizobium delmotii]
MNGLLKELLACHDAAQQTLTQEEPMDRVVVAGSAVLAYHASLPPALARRIMPNRGVARQCCDIVISAVDKYYNLTLPTYKKLEANRDARLKLVRETQCPPASLDQLSNMYASVAKAHVACMDWCEKRTWGCERQRLACATNASLPGETAEMPQDDQIALRRVTGELMFAQFGLIEARVDLANVKIESQVRTFEPSLRPLLMFEEGRVPLLKTFLEDVAPAFASAVPAVRDSTGRPLDADHCSVLEGIVKRLSEFGLALQDMRANLSDHRTASGLPLELLDQIVEEVSINADQVVSLLALQPKPPAIIAPPADTSAGIRAAAPKKEKKKDKSKQAAGARTSVADASKSAAGRLSPQLAGGVRDPVPVAKVLVRTDLGTKKLVSAEEAQKSASSAAARLATWQAPTSKEMLTPQLARLAELLQFDLPGQQKLVSQARQMSPEDVEHVVDTVVERLQTQAAEMEACVAAFKEPRLRLLLSPAQISKLHDDTEQLNNMLSQAQGQAKFLNEQKTTITTDCMKTYPFPSQNYLEHLRAAGELKPPGPPCALKGEPGNLFEIGLQHEALSNRATPKPMWVHIHTKRPVYARQLAMLDTAEFAACHVKSHQQRGFNRQWQDARAAIGHENIAIHRGKLTPAFCKSLLTT